MSNRITHIGYYFGILGLAYVVTSLLASSDGHGVRVGIKRKGSPSFNVLDYGAIGDGKHEDTRAFSKAWRDVCDARGNVPTLVVPREYTFLLTPVLFEGPCESNTVHVQIEGKIVAPDSIEGWGNSCEGDAWLSFEYVDNLVVYGHGQLDGKGSVWWNKDARPCCCPRLLSFLECNGLRVRDLKLKDSPSGHLKLLGCDNSTISNIHITAPEESPNTDGIDISSTSQLEILDLFIATGDDCIAISSHTSWINVRGVTCGPGHGISVGSLGRHGTEAKVEEIHVENCTFHGTQNGARIKTWQGGSGYARKITFRDINLINVSNPIIIDQYYCGRHHCKEEPRAVAVEQVTFSRFQGTSASVAAITLNCSQAIPCTHIIMEKINITSSTPTDKTYSFCQNVHGKQTSVAPPVPCM